MAATVALYSAVGDELTHYAVDIERADILKRATIVLPANVQYAWPHPSRRFLYVATSNRGAGLKGDRNHLCAYRIDPASGALTLHGTPQTLPQRAVHICVDPSGGFVLSGHNLQAGISVNHVNADGSLGPAVSQANPLDFGIYPHQVRMTPSGRTTILVDRGNAAHDGKPVEPGALRLFRFDAGVLSEPQVVAPGGGYAFGPRHLDFHPTQPWVYVSLEIQSELRVFRLQGDRLEEKAAYTKDMLADRANMHRRQLGGTVHVHPNGRYVYLVNRADGTTDFEGHQVFNGGENSIAVFAIDQATGEPTLIQHADTQSFHVRTFSIDPSGRLLIAGSIQPIAVREGTQVVTIPAALTIFRVGKDGRLGFARKVDVGPADKIQYWTGMVGLD